MHKRTNLRRWLACGAAAGVLAMAVPALAEQAPTYAFDVAAQPMTEAVQDVGRQAGVNILVDPSLVAGRRAPAVRGEMTMEVALAQILAGTDLQVQRTAANSLLIRRATQDPQGGGAGGDVDALIVTAQKREENIQDVPIAISAFSQEALERSQIAGGPDLMTQIPNFTFTKTNFTGYSIQIRGIGTQAISATTDPAVAVAFNNTPFVRNRFFEQEFYDLERVEVLRGPQGTLYGRNATAGVVNIISAKPKFGYEAKLSADLGNYNATRLEGMVNFPLVEDVAALRIAGAWTTREGYSTNAFTGNPIDGRDLWSTRATLRLTPTDALDVNLIWEHFEENDDRIRSGKQLCKKDPNKTQLAGIAFPFESQPGINSSKIGTYNQGCIAASLYSPESFQTPNGFALPYIHPLAQLGLPTTSGLDPYASQSQSRDLRVIESLVDPHYSAQSNVAELQAKWDLGKGLSLASETAYSTDKLFSTQDYNRFITQRGIFSQTAYQANVSASGIPTNVLNGGVFCDPQIGCSDRLVAIDLSTAASTNFSQELRLSSDYDGPVNFSFGANFTRYDTEDKYYVFINSLSLWAALQSSSLPGRPNSPYAPGVTDNSACLSQPAYGDPSIIHLVFGCMYMDPNPIDSLNDQGHNYFLSKNPYRLISYAAFGELYYNVTDSLKITGGLRWTVDKKHAPSIPSWLLAAGTVGYPVKEILDLEWQEPTGRLTIDWKPVLPFTDETLVYASYAHGYKAGGANPPTMVVVATLDNLVGFADSVLHPKTFDPEFVDAFEIGAKNTLFDGRLTLNTSAFYYDYTGYQVSQIVDRTAVNSNFDAEVWGLEIEADWRATDNLRFGFKGGYEKTRLADGMQAIDLMDRTAGKEGWVVAKPFPSLASNCILPLSLVTFGNRINTLRADGSGEQQLGDVGFCVKAYIFGHDPVTDLPYTLNPTIRADPDISDLNRTAPLGSNWVGLGYAGFNPATAPNNGAGFYKDLSGNELPNAPRFTGTLTADYAVPLAGDWSLNLHADLYYQSEAWTRVFNTEGYDKLKAYTNLNFAATFTNEEAGWKVMAYVKNVMDRDSITGAFLNSDDSGLTTNVFLTEPRLYGVRLTKDFTDVPLLGSWFGGRRDPDSGLYPFTVELAGGPSRFDAGVDNWAPSWLGLYSAQFPGPLTIDDNELDWGDNRSVTLTYTPSKAWQASLAYRFGRTNGSDRQSAYEAVPGGYTPCLFSCTLLYSTPDPNNWIATVADHEEYDITEFKVGREIGIGLADAMDRSVVSLGVRYAEFVSSTDSSMDGTPYYYSPPLFSQIGLNGLPSRFHTRYSDTFAADREFSGYGPVLSWDASLRLFDQVAGRLDLDWSVSGGALFGRQESRIEEHQVSQYFIGLGVTVTHVDPPVVSHSKDVTVPTASAALGLSYTVDRLKLSTGYSYERYFDVIDGGVGDHKDYDRTIQGPYFKLSIGFGG